MTPARSRAERPALSRERVLAEAVVLADAEGLAALSMRTLARRLGVEAMSLYHHEPNKEALLDGMVDLVFGEMHAPRPGADWAAELRLRSVSGRQVLLRHRWAVGLMDSRSAPATQVLLHHDAVLGCLRTAGFSLALAGHAFAVLDAHLYGFLVQELALPFGTEEELQALGASIMAQLPADGVPHFVEFATQHAMQPGYAFGDEFEWGLDLVLEGLERRRRAEAGHP